MHGLLYRIGRWCAGHGVMVVTVWFLIAAALLVSARAFGTPNTSSISVPGSDSRTAAEITAADFAKTDQESTPLFVRSDDEPLDDSAFARAMADTTEALREVAHVESVISPTSKEGTGCLAEDRRTGYFALTLDKSDRETAQAIDDAAAPLRSEGLETALGGSAGQRLDQNQGHRSEAIGLLAAIIVLLIAFRSVVAMAVPIVTGLLAVAAGLAGVGLLGHGLDIPAVATTLATMIGLGVGIDYALFLVTRHRAQLADGLPVAESVARATATSGSAVVFAGTTVIIAISGLAIAGVSFVTALGIASAILVAVAMLAALTLLPAVLGLLGPRVNRFVIGRPRREPHGEAPAAASAGPFRGPSEGGGWAKLAHHVERRAWFYSAICLLALMALAAPVTSLSLGQTDAGTAQPGTQAREAYDLMSEGFGPGRNGPLQIVATLREPLSGPDDPEAKATADRLRAALEPVTGIAAVSPAEVSENGRSLRMTVTPETGPADPATVGLIQELRTEVLPEVPSMNAHVGGATAVKADLSQRIAQRLPWLIGAVVAISFLLLVLVFRSVIVPLKAAAMNLLSVGAAYGVIVVVFHWGHGLALVGLEDTVPIESYVPMLLFVVLFGLSMDYEVFLLGSVQEAYASTGDARASVRTGLASTGRTITSAAAIMVAVFAAFVLNTDPVVKMFGVGLATAVLVDATIIRCLLVPALMVLMGNANWWLPKWMAWLPHLAPEGPSLDQAEQKQQPDARLPDEVEQGTGHIVQHGDPWSGG